MSDFRLAVLAAQADDVGYATLKYNLEQGIYWLGDAWQHSPPAGANFIIVLVNSIKSLKPLQTLQGSYPHDRIIVATSIQLELPQIKWLLPFQKSRPCPTVISLVNLLSRIQEYFQDNKPVYLKEVFVPEHYLPNIIESSKQDGMARQCSLATGLRLIIVPKEQAYYYEDGLEQITPIVGAKLSAFNVETLSDPELAVALKSLKPSQPIIDSSPKTGNHQCAQSINLPDKGTLFDLLWLSVLIASGGRRLGSYQLRDKVTLLEIPDILLTDYFSVEYKKLSELLISKPVSVFEASAAANRSLFDTINFYNACTQLKMTEIKHQP